MDVGPVPLGSVQLISTLFEQSEVVLL